MFYLTYSDRLSELPKNIISFCSEIDIQLTHNRSVLLHIPIHYSSFAIKIDDRKFMNFIMQIIS